jgi:methionine aminopeptidase
MVFSRRPRFAWDSDVVGIVSRFLITVLFVCFFVPQVDKGIAFPTCISVNNCVGHFSPLKSDIDVLLHDGDVVKM